MSGLLGVLNRPGSRPLFSQILRCAFSASTSRPVRQQSSPKKKHDESEEEKARLSFQQEIKAICPNVLATAMGGSNQPPEEPLLSSLEEGFGYFPAAALGYSLGQYQFARKVRM